MPEEMERDIRQRVMEGDTGAIADFLELQRMVTFVMQEIGKNVTAELPIPKERLYELGLTILRDSDDVWQQVQDELQRTRSPEWFDQFMTKKACHQGCSYCCYLHVEVTKVECLAIAQYFQMTLPPDELQVLVDQIRESASRLTGLDASSRIPYKIPCGLLDQETNTCRGYAIRPLSCRGYNSLDLAYCRDGFGVDGATTPIEIWQSYLYNAIMFGLLEALRPSGLESELIELNSGLMWAFAEINRNH